MSPSTMITMSIHGEIIDLTPFSRECTSRALAPPTPQLPTCQPPVSLSWACVGYSAAIDAASQRPPSAHWRRPAAPQPPPVACAACYGHLVARPQAAPLRLDLDR